MNVIIRSNCSDANNAHCTECPANFTYIAPVNGCYQLVTHKLNWTSAGQECRSLHKDAHLLVINDAQEQWSVAGMIESVRCKCRFHILFIVTVSELIVTAAVVMQKWMKSSAFVTLLFCVSSCLQKISSYRIFVGSQQSPLKIPGVCTHQPKRLATSRTIGMQKRFKNYKGPCAQWQGGSEELQTKRHQCNYGVDWLQEIYDMVPQSWMLKVIENLTSIKSKFVFKLA